MKRKNSKFVRFFFCVAVIFLAMGLTIAGPDSAVAAPSGDPLVSAWFGVEVSGIAGGSFSEVLNLGSENEVVDHRVSGPRGEMMIQKIPGKLSFTSITIKRGITKDLSFLKWRQMVEGGQIAQARRAVTIIMYNQQGIEVARWSLKNAWPSKLIYNPPDPTKSGIPAALESITIVAEGIVRIK